MSDFDGRAATWDDDPEKWRRARTTADSIRAAIPLDRTLRVLEYGAGTGLISQQLLGEVGPLTLAEPSEGMRTVLHQKVADGVLPRATIWNLDLSRDPVPDARFDLIITSLTLHHIPDIAPVLRAFFDLLATHGVLCIADLDEEDGSFHGPGFADHDGFDRDQLARQLTACGFGSTEFTHGGDLIKAERTYGLFLATTLKSPELHSRMTPLTS